MAELTGSYDPSEVTCIVAGVILSGFSDGDAIIARRSEDVYSKKVGIDGGVGRARNADKTGEFEFKLLQTSHVNELLSELLRTSNLSEDGKAVFPISVVDGSGLSLAFSSHCWIKTIPEGTFGKEVGERSWVFDAAALRLFHGGGN